MVFLSFVVDQLLSHVWLCDPMDCSTPSLPALHCLLEFAQTHVHWVSDAIQPSHPLLPPFPLVLNLSSIRVFSNESALRIRWPKYWKFSFSISPSNEYSGLISFRIDSIDLLQATLKSLLQHHNLKALILWTFLMVQLLYSYMTVGKPQLWLHGPLSAKCFPLIKKKKKSLEEAMQVCYAVLGFWLPSSELPQSYKIAASATAITSLSWAARRGEGILVGHWMSLSCMLPERAFPPS